MKGWSMTASREAATPRPAVFADDLAVGDRVELGEHLVERAELLEFACRWDNQWFHTDEAAAQHGHFGDVIASGIHTLAILQRLTVQAIYGDWAVVAGRELESVRFLEAVRPEDVLTGSIEITDIKLGQSRGRVTMRGQLVNQHGTPVLSSDLTIVMFRRGSHAD